MEVGEVERTDKALQATRRRRRAAVREMVALPSAALVADAAAPELVVISLELLDTTARNPRSDATHDLDGLTASVQTAREPYLLQPPTIEPDGTGRYRVIAGERRVRSVRAAGWTTVACLVRPAVAPLLAHTLRLVENLHRLDLHPLDLALALKIAWLAENGAALDAGTAVAQVLATEQPPAATLAALHTVVRDAGFVPTHPRISWEVLLGQLGLALDGERRKKLLRVLNLDAQAVALVRPLEMSEAALRALGTLDASDQVELATAVVADAALASKIRRIARRVKQKGYPIAKALAEARGQVYAGEGAEAVPAPAPQAAQGAHTLGREADEMREGGELAMHAAASGGATVDTPLSPSVALLEVGPDAADAVLRLLDLAEQVTRSITTLREHAGDVSLPTLPPPWGEIATEALEILRSATAEAAR